MKAENEFQYRIINRDVRDEAGKPTNIPTLSTMYTSGGIEICYRMNLMDSIQHSKIILSQIIVRSLKR